MKRKELEKYTLSGCYRYHGLYLQVGFVLPVFKRASTEDYFIQICEDKTGLIREFITIETDEDLIEPVENLSLTVRIGDPQVYAFIEGPGKIVFGSLREIQPELDAFLVNDEHHPGIQLQISRLMADGQQRVKYSQAVMARIAAFSGKAAADFMNENSSFPNRVHEIISKTLIDGIGEGRVNQLRRLVLLNAEVRNEEVLPKFAWDTLDAFTNASKSDILEAIKAECNLNKALLPPFAQNNDKEKYNNHRTSILEKWIFSQRRQEMRLAALTRVLLVEPDVGRIILENFTDKSAASKKAATTIKHRMQKAESYLSANSDSPKFKSLAIQNVIVDALACVYNTWFPRHRGELLIAMSLFLSDQVQISRWIAQQSTRKSASFHVVGNANLSEFLTASNTDEVNTRIGYPNP